MKGFESESKAYHQQIGLVEDEFWIKQQGVGRTSRSRGWFINYSLQPVAAYTMIPTDSKQCLRLLAR